MLIFLALVATDTAGVFASTTMTIFDFSDEKAIREWMPVNDTVMGGVSSGRLEPTGAATVMFTGQVSLENNGGFASVRSRPQSRDLRGFAGLSLRVRGDGGRYKINLKNDASFDGILYRAAFETDPDQWQTVTLPFDAFVPTFRGRLVRNADPLDPARIVSIGLMISDKQAGPFRLEIASIEAITH